MKTSLSSTIPEPTELEIQHAAYLLWLESGKAPGRDLCNWLAAKELLRHRHGRSAGDKRYRGAVSGARHSSAAPAAVAPSNN